MKLLRNYASAILASRSTSPLFCANSCSGGKFLFRTWAGSPGWAAVNELTKFDTPLLI